MKHYFLRAVNYSFLSVAYERRGDTSALLPTPTPYPRLQAGGRGEVTHSGAARPWLHDVLGVSHPGNNGPVRRCSAAARHVLRWRRSYDAAVPWLLWRRCTQLAVHCLGGGLELYV